MGPGEAALLLAGGGVAGVVNTLAGGGSLLTVPLLVLVGLPGGVANGTNRLGILLQAVLATGSFRLQGISEFRNAGPVLLPVAVGSVVGAAVVSQVPDDAFERLFGIVMLVLLVPTLRRARPGGERRGGWSPPIQALVFFGIGLYGGAFQAGVGIALLFALAHAGFDLVRANALKMIVVAALTLVAVPVFVAEGQIAWAPAGVLAAGYAVGGLLGARVAVRGGERVIRPVLAGAVVLLAGRMVGLY